MNETLAKNSVAKEDEAAKHTMLDESTYPADIVDIRDTENGDTDSQTVQGQTYAYLTHSTAPGNLPQTCPPFTVHAVKATNYFAAGVATMETAVDKHEGISQQWCHNISHGAQISPGGFVNRVTVSEGRTSPARSMHLFPTPASSRESILSEGWDGERSWSSLRPRDGASPGSLSGTVSPCSSVPSGMFTPTVVKVRKHVLAPGSSLLQMPSSLTSSCESLTSAPSQHRPPLTRLSLLTAILRKGRLPVLSSALQRPYSPCWPVNPMTLSSCKACSAASSVASIPFKVSSSSKALACVEGQPHNRGRLDSYRSATAPMSVQFKELLVDTGYQTQPRSFDDHHSNNGLKWETVESHPAKTSPQDCLKAGNENLPPKVPLTLLSSRTSKLTSVSPDSVNHNESSESTVPKRFLDSRPKFDSTPRKTSNSRYTEDNAQHIALGKLNPWSLKPVNEPKSSVPQQSVSQPYSSLAGLDSLSTRLKSVALFRTDTQPSTSRSSSVSSEMVSPALSQDAVKRTFDLEQRFLVPTNGTTRVYKAHCLSPSRYTPIHFPGWPSPTVSLASTPDRLTLTPSPASTIRDLTPSPCLSLRSTPSPSPWGGISDGYEGKKRKPHKIKSSYKSLAAIPTNTLLLDQQAIEEQIDREDPCEALDRGITDTHIEMCSPAQLRQESEELYAAIDEILEDSIPKCKRPRVPQPSSKSTYTTGPQKLLQIASLPKSLGRETKYATLCSMHPSTSAERMADRKTRPGVICPMTALSRLTLDKDEKGVRRYRAADNKQVEDMSLVEIEEDANITSGGQPCSKETDPVGANTISVSALLITEFEGQCSYSAKERAWHGVPASFEVLTEAFETHI